MFGRFFGLNWSREPGSPQTPNLPVGSDVLTILPVTAHSNILDSPSVGIRY